MIRIEQLNFAVGDFALRDVSLHVRPGEYFVLLGPSGSGKTLLLECLCGLSRIDSGRISVDARNVTHLEPRHRGMGYVPQDYALFPHRTVRQNVGFGRRNSESTEVAQWMQVVGVAHLADRFPGKLSGGEKQRVALARALAIGPRMLLLDEPVSALDEQTRDKLCRELKGLQRSIGTTTMHVCHDFAEMLMVADRVGIIQRGKILQVGTPQEVLQHPCNTQVARFVQAGNLLSARVDRPTSPADGHWTKLLCAGRMELRAATPGDTGIDGEVVVMVRPENIRLASACPEHLPPGTTLLEGSIREVHDLGPVVRARVACGEEAELQVSLGKGEFGACHVGTGDTVYLSICPEDVHVMYK